MKIGMLTQWFDPETGPAALPGVYAREFAQQGHSVDVLTGFPNYPEGKLYPGYKLRPRSHETTGSVRVTRVALYPNHSASKIGRALNYSSFALSSALLAGGATRGVDALWVYNSPITVSLPLLVHSRLGRTPIFLHVQDLWPDSLVESGMFTQGWVGQRITRTIEAIVRLIESRSAAIGVISKSVRELILERHPGIDPEKIFYVPNPTNEQLFRPASIIRDDTAVKRDSSVVEFMYAGAIGEVQGLDTLIEAAHLLRNRGDISITLVGDGISKARLERRVAESRLKNVTFTGRVPQQVMPSLIARADVQLVSLASSPFLAYTTPSKIPSLLASEVPIVAQLDGDGAAMVRDSGAGIVVQPGRAPELADAIRKLADTGEAHREAMARSGRQYYEQNLSAQAAVSKIINALRETTCSSARVGAVARGNDRS